MRGPALMLAGIGLYGLLDANNKLLSSGYSVWQVLLVRFITLLAVVGAMRLLRRGWGGPLAVRHPRLHLLRACGMLGSATCFFQAFSRLPLAEGYLVFFTSPFLVLALSALWLREPPSRAAWAWSALGFGGVALGLAPGLLREAGSGSLAGYGFAAVGTCCYSMVFILNRQLRGDTGVARVLVWPAVVGFAVMLPMGLAHWSPLQPLALGQMVANGVVVGAATVLIADAFKYAAAARLAPFAYSGLVWGLSWDFAFWGRVPEPLMLVGAAVVVLACLMSERAAQRRS